MIGEAEAACPQSQYERGEFRAEFPFTPARVAELLDPDAWGPVLSVYARTIKVAVALTDVNGWLLGVCHNPQAAWLGAQGGGRAYASECPFCLAPELPCTAVTQALQSGQVTLVHDLAGLAHVAVPIILGGEPIGAIIAGQVFDRYPDQLILRRAAKVLNVPAQSLWHTATLHPPVSRSNLLVYGELLAVLGSSFVRDCYANILSRRLTEANNRCQLMIDGAQEYGFFSVNEHATVTSWNSGAERLFGYESAEILGKPCELLFSPESLEGAIHAANLPSDKEDAYLRNAGWKVRKDGSRFFAEDLLAALENSNPREFGFLIHDVSERRDAEAALLQSHKLESIGVLASGIAHDFNNLLTGILGGLSFVRSTLPPDHAAAPVLRLAEESSERAAALTHQLLAYAGKGQFIIRAFDFCKLVRDLLPLIESSIPKSVDIQLNLADGLPTILADPSQIEQVVMNLVINAAEAIGPGCGAIRIAASTSEWRAPDGASRTEVVMEVADSGSGMSDATKARIFDPFFTTKFTGRGLGLAAVSGIIRSHEGRMTVESSPGRGTTFRVFFPAGPVAAAREATRAEAATKRGTGTILVVEDEAPLRLLSEAMLESLGYEVLVAENGREALKILSEQSAAISAVLLDMTMPVMGGKETLLRMREIRPGLRVIITTGYSEELAREELGPFLNLDYIQKPYNVARLEQKIREVLTRAPERAALAF